MKKKSLAVGYLLALFLGVLGGHLFYYKKYLRGILYLIFSWTYIPMLLGWIDMIFIKKWTDKHNSEILSNESIKSIGNLKEEKSINTIDNLTIPAKSSNQNVKLNNKKALFYDEEKIILNKYAHLTTAENILKSLEQFQRGNDSKNNDLITFSVYRSGDELVKDSFSYATTEGSKSKEVPLMEYWPTFRNLSKERLNWYLYWRNQTLKGNYLDVDLSYLCLFAYELLNYSFNSNAAFNVSMLVNLYENYKDRIQKIDNYFPRWIADMLYELEEPELAKKWDKKEIAIPKIYSILDENLELKNLSITDWKPYLTGYKETGFFNTHKNKIYKQFKTNIGALQTYYDKQNLDLKDLWFEKITSREIRSLFLSAVIGRSDTQIHTHVTYIKSKAEMTKLISSLFKLSENMVRKSVGENRQLKVDESVLPKNMQESILEINNRFKTVKKQGELVQGSAIPTKPKVEVQPNIVEIDEQDTSKNEVQFDWGKINKSSKELDELTEKFVDQGNDFEVDLELDSKSPKIDHQVLPLSKISNEKEIFNNLNEKTNNVEEFINSLLENEIKFLKLTKESVIKLQEATNFAKSNGMMLNVLISDLNEKAEEILGDILLEEEIDELLVTEEFLNIVVQLK